MRKICRTKLAALAAILTAGGLAACQPPLPTVEGWRELTAEEFKTLAAERRADDATTPPPVISVGGDFNGDGKRDRVAFLVSDANAQFTPYMFDGAGGPPTPLAHGDARSRMWRYSLAVLPPGILYGICQEEAEEGRNCARDAPSTTPAIVFFEFNHGGSSIAWNGSNYVEHHLSDHVGLLPACNPALESLARNVFASGRKPMETNADLPTFHRVPSDN
jgi:hypothetical protein